MRRCKLRDVSVGTEQEQEPSALQILQTLSSLEVGSVFLGGRAELGLHEINVTDGNAKNTDSLLLGQSIASPFACVRINAFCSPLHRATPRWVVTCPLRLGTCVLLPQGPQTVSGGGIRKSSRWFVAMLAEHPSVGPAPVFC